MMRKKNNPCNFVIVVIILGQSFFKWKLLTGKDRQLIVFIKSKIYIFENITNLDKFQNLLLYTLIAT